MTDTTKRYSRQDRNQEKIDKVKLYFEGIIMGWLESRPTGKMAVGFEIVANDGGVKEVHFETKERGRV